MVKRRRWRGRLVRLPDTIAPDAVAPAKAVARAAAYVVIVEISEPNAPEASGRTIRYATAAGEEAEAAAYRALRYLSPPASPGTTTQIVGVETFACKETARIRAKRLRGWTQGALAELIAQHKE